MENFDIVNGISFDRKLSRSLKTIAKGPYVITLHAREDNTLYCAHDIHIRYTDEAGGITEISCPPTRDEPFRAVSIYFQLGYAETLINFFKTAYKDKVKTIRSFLNGNPNFPLSDMSLEAGLNPEYLHFFVRSNMLLTEPIVEKLTLVLKKYGYGG